MAVLLRLIRFIESDDYKLEKDQAAKHQSNLRLSSTSQNPVGLNYYHKNLQKSNNFTKLKQDELIDELNGLTNEIETIEKQGIQLVQDSFNQSTRSNEEAVDDEDDDEEDEDEHDDDVGRASRGDHLLVLTYFTIKQTTTTIKISLTLESYQFLDFPLKPIVQAIVVRPP
ncbi:hypothetical protein Pst134EA_011755 [Puccinia striiformis f. sp. tritici]|uniref:hypothetical protein n=1 Tax=Puccinia striiformis f. sp. tritici TaxID=168172 RepID=UPI0020076582|nr:hypothetical protein Pst134EA_011755 [Puccinia striiformis f. sp. tritici]KAH9468134.1 hypothetical protein Pst134EA_011755 [Puccinia striiformis f. sp. tritici]